MHVEILTSVDLHRVAVSELAERIGQLAGSRHRRAHDEHGDERYVLAQRRLDLDPDRISLVVKPVVFSVRAYPMWTNDGEHHIACPERTVDVAAEIDADRYVIDVSENGLAAIARDQAVEDAPGDGARILTP